MNNDKGKKRIMCMSTMS